MIHILSVIHVLVVEVIVQDCTNYARHVRVVPIVGEVVKQVVGFVVS